MKSLVLFLLSVTLLFSAQSRIINGQEVSNSDPKYKAIVTLYKNNSFTCGATAISPTWVLTAAHCVSTPSGTKTKANILKVLVDTYNRSNATGRFIDVKQVVVHPNYRGDNNDLALLELKDSVTNMMPLRRDGAINVGDTTYVAGWGNTFIKGTNFPAQLNAVELPLISLSTCNAKNSYNGGLFNTQICAGYMSGANIKDSCVGDSGGPLITKVGDEYKLTGLVSYGGSTTQLCAAPNFPGIYTKVSSFISWIESYTGDLSAIKYSSGVDENIETSRNLESALLDLSTNEWSLLGTSEAITDMSVFDDVRVVLVYKNGAYKAYSPDINIRIELRDKGYEVINSIDANSGFWIKK